MDLPPPVAQRRMQQQQRPSISYFVFLAFLFYLMNSNQSQQNSLAFESRDEASFEQRISDARASLLRREARAEGIARWLGRSNATGEYLNSTYYPAVANGTAPVAPVPGANATNPPRLGEAYRIPPFEPHNGGEPAPVFALVARLFAHATPRDDTGRVEARVYPQNLTGYAKGAWETRTYSFQELGLDETWTTERLVRVPDEAERRNGSGAALEVATAEGITAASALRRRQVPVTDDTLAPQTNLTTHLTTVLDVHNRTLARGTFPWVSSPPSTATHHASFNFREMRTSAVGPIEPLTENPDELDEAALLRLRDHPEAWADWEREGPVTYLWGPLTLRVERKGGEDKVTELDVEAVHFLTSGRIYGYATPRFVRAHIIDVISHPLMSASPSPALANRTARAIGHAMLKEYNRRVAKDVVELEQNGPRFSEDDYAREDSDEGQRVPECTFSLYAALSPLPREYTFSRYTELYTSLFRPSGASFPAPPVSTLSALLSSPNCGLVLSVPAARLTSTQTLWLRAAHFGVLFVLAQGTALGLLVRQLERAAGRPGTVANAQPAGFAMNVICDLYVFVVTLLVGVVTDSRASLPFLAGSFLALLSSVLFGLRYVAIIRESTPAPTPTPVPAPATVPGADVGADEPADESVSERARRALPERVGSVLAGWRAKQTIYATLALSVIVVAGYLVSQGWTPFFLAILYSYWIPQIVLNVHRGTARQSLADEYVVGTTLARLVPPLYFWGWEGNCMMVETTPKIYYLVGYSFLQAAILVGQSRLSRTATSSSRFVPSGGARFFLPAGIIRALELPELSTWDYHPRVLPADLEAGKSSSDADAEEDCPICLSAVHVRPTKAELAAGQADEVRRAAAITPCAHVVHTECLEQWMMVRAVCPLCKSALPPLAA